MFPINGLCSFIKETNIETSSSKASCASGNTSQVFIPNDLRGRILVNMDVSSWWCFCFVATQIP